MQEPLFVSLLFTFFLTRNINYKFPFRNNSPLTLNMINKTRQDRQMDGQTDSKFVWTDSKFVWAGVCILITLTHIPSKCILIFVKHQDLIINAHLTSIPHEQPSKPFILNKTLTTCNMVCFQENIDVCV